MKIELLKSSHSVGECNYHLQFTPAYRRDVFADNEVARLTRHYFLEAAEKHGISIAAAGFGRDHCHLFVIESKNHSVVQVVNLLKGYTSRLMRERHWHLFKRKLWGDSFWSSGYFYRSVGAVNSETVRHYVAQSQDKHWTTSKKNGAQRKLIEFAS